VIVGIDSWASMKSSALIRLAVSLTLSSALACDGDPLRLSPANLDGSWSRLDQFPGNSEQWNLSIQGSSIAGTGTWTGEACCSGQLTITGTISSGEVHVDVTWTGVPNGPIQEHFDGALTSRGILEGQQSRANGTPSPARFQKQ
jgi:hypothetical protein